MLGAHLILPYLPGGKVTVLQTLVVLHGTSEERNILK
jgi:hypothetical protein